MDTSDLAKRMKKYESVPKSVLMRRTPVIIRLDGKAFHTFTRGFERPYDKILMASMQETMKYLCENIQGCVIGYTQSDEITLVLVDYKKLESDAWFDYEVHKMCSIASSMATMIFNKVFSRNTADYAWKNQRNYDAEMNKLLKSYGIAIQKGAMFDARVFNIPKEEVTNNIYWRQLDASRNSIQMLGQANFSQSELHKKTCSQIQDMLVIEKGINWNDMPTAFKRGSCCIKVYDEALQRSRWVIDTEIPIFKGEGRAYIDNLVFVGE